MDKKKNPRYAKVSLILTPEQSDYLRSRAGREYRSISSLMRMLLAREMAQDAQDKRTEQPPELVR